jgi:hypothetical protein
MPQAGFAAAHGGHLEAGMLKTQSIHGMIFIGVHRRPSAVLVLCH